ncbi:MAG: hypothetical protein CMJ34_00230 [Phycisphaerae bacterium]|nr:hypothetical protein [Phycisphaerae bacterium]
MAPDSIRRAATRSSAWLPAVLLCLAAWMTPAPAHGQVCEKAIGDCLDPHGLPGCSDLQCCETVCLLDSFCCEEWDENCVQLADLSCVGLCGTSISGSCFSANGTPGCDDRACCETICLADPFCCKNAWDGNCSLLAGFACQVPGGECGDRGTGDCFDSNGTPSCEDETCCQAVCAIDPTCCDSIWDELCVALAESACGGLCVVGTDGTETIEAEACDGKSNDPCSGGEAEPVGPDGVVAGTFSSTADVDVLELDLTPLDLDGDGLVRTRALFVASSATISFRPGGCDSPAEFEIASIGCIGVPENRCLAAGVWTLEIRSTGEVGDCEDLAWKLRLESADTCGPVCGRPESCLQPHAHPGCEDESCCNEVCVVDPVCCDWSWDSTCASHAAEICGGDPPANDLCADAIEIDEGLHDFRQLLSSSTGPASECVPAKLRGGDVWFRHLSTCDGLMKIGTCSLADFDTVVDVYRGDCESPVPVACIDDDVFCTFDTASIFFDAECGVEYLIRISGVEGSMGNGAVELQCFVPPCDACQGDLDGDGEVGGADFGLLLSAWGACSEDCPADLDGDGEVSGTDIGLMLAVWGDC